MTVGNIQVYLLVLLFLYLYTRFLHAVSKVMQNDKAVSTHPCTFITEL